MSIDRYREQPGGCQRGGVGWLEKNAELLLKYINAIRNITKHKSLCGTSRNRTETSSFNLFMIFKKKLLCVRYGINYMAR